MNSRLLPLCSFFSFIILFTSCSQYDEDYLTNEATRANHTITINSLEIFVSENIKLTNELAQIITKSEEINLEKFMAEFENIKSTEEFENLLISSNFNSSGKILQINNSMLANALEFKNRNPQFFNLDESERNNLIANETYRQISPNDGNQEESCQSEYTNAQNACATGYGIGLAGAAASGIFTGGIGWLIGWGASSVGFVICMETALSNFNNCLQ